MKDYTQPVHRERLLDLKSATVVANPGRLELPAETPAAATSSTELAAPLSGEPEKLSM